MVLSGSWFAVPRVKCIHTHACTHARAHKIYNLTSPYFLVSLSSSFITLLRPLVWMGIVKLIGLLHILRTYQCQPLSFVQHLNVNYAIFKWQTYLVLHNITCDDRADDARQCGHCIGQSHQHTGMLWGYVQVIHTVITIT